MSLPVLNTPSLEEVASTSGWLLSSSEREASVTEAQPKERVTMAKRAKIDLSDFMIDRYLVIIFLVKYKSN